MQIDYKILWIDNDLDEYIKRGQIEELEEYITELGFKPYILPLINDNELDDNLNTTKFDLIISDYNLDNTTGDKIIKHIRNQNIMTEILFYSAKTNFEKEPQIIDSLRFVNRISFQYGRDNLMNRIFDLIKLTLDKLLDLNATRGIITSATSELDVIIEELTILLINDKLEKEQKDKDSIISHYVDDFLSKSSERFQSKYKDIGFENIFQSIEANRKWNIFRSLLKELNKIKPEEQISKFLQVNKTYFEEVINIRNKFAHSKAENIKGRMVLKGQYGKDDFEFNEEKCIEIRKNLIKHKDNFNELKLLFGI